MTPPQKKTLLTFYYPKAMIPEILLAIYMCKDIIRVWGRRTQNLLVYQFCTGQVTDSDRQAQAAMQSGASSLHMESVY